MTDPGRIRPLAARSAPSGPDRARTMRIVAGSLLLAMAALFLIAHRYVDVHPAWGFVLAFAEAAMVGGLADWFAVTALFRRPLGLPIPHTAIIPENKNRIADTMAAFLQANFLTPTVVARRMRAMNLARAAGDFLSGSGSGSGLQSRVREGAGELLAEILESLDPERLGTQVRAGLGAQIERVEISPLLGRALSAAIADKRHLPLIEGLIRWAGLTLEDNEEMVRRIVSQRSNALVRWAGLDDRLASSVLDGIYKLLAEVLIDPDHPLRSKVQEGLENLAHDLEHDPAMRARVEETKRELLANPALGEWWMGVWERIRQRMIDVARDPQLQGGGWLASAMAELGSALHRDPRLQQQVNRLARRTAVGVTSRYGGQIVQLVSETVRRWDGRTVSDRIEGAVGRDLQFIRVNGTLVGGLVGLTIHAIGQLL